MNIRDEIKRSAELLKPGRDEIPSPAHRHLACVLWKGDAEEIEKALAMIQRAEFFARIPIENIYAYIQKKAPYWELSESKGDQTSDLLA